MKSKSTLKVAIAEKYSASSLRHEARLENRVSAAKNYPITPPHKGALSDQSAPFLIPLEKNLNQDVKHYQSNDAMGIIEQGLARLARIDDATNVSKTPEQAAHCDAAFKVTARAVAREMTRLADRVKAHPASYISVLRKYVGMEAERAVAPNAYGSESQWRYLAAKLILPGIERALQNAA